jgi:hypothetical protein
VTLAAPHRLVAAAMAELELVSLAAEGDGESWWPRQMPKIGLLPRILRIFS